MVWYVKQYHGLPAFLGNKAVSYFDTVNDYRTLAMPS